MTNLAQSTSLLPDGCARPNQGVKALAHAVDEEMVKRLNSARPGTSAPGCAADLDWLSLSTAGQGAPNTESDVCRYTIFQFESDLDGSLPSEDRYM